MPEPDEDYSAVVERALSPVVGDRVSALRYLAGLPAAQARSAGKQLLARVASDLRIIEAVFKWSIDFRGDRKALSEFLASFIFPLHFALVRSGQQELSLRLELFIYASFIKQCEEEKFYRWAFEGLYRPYVKISSRSNKSGFEDIGRVHSATIFFFQNFSPLAHVRLFLEQLESVRGLLAANIYVFALFPCSDRASVNRLAELGVPFYECSDRGALTKKFSKLVNLATDWNVSDVVFVSTPLHAPFCSKILPDCRFTWWSHKFALSTIPFFDYLVCFRALSKTLRVIDGAQWRAGPLALAPLSLAEPMVSMESVKGICLGVLAREEKILSSNLPEVVGSVLRTLEGIDFTFTARGDGAAVVARALGVGGQSIADRVRCVGWVDPPAYLSGLDILLDTPTLGGLSCYWAMSAGIPVISALPTGSVGALSDRSEIARHFSIVTDESDVCRYETEFDGRPFVLASFSPLLVVAVITRLVERPDFRREVGESFRKFFLEVLGDRKFSASVQFEWMGFNLRNPSGATLASGVSRHA